MSKKYGTLLEKQGRTQKWRFPVDLFTWTCQCWLTNKKLPTTALHGYRIELRWSTESDGTYLKMGRESQGNLCWQRDLNIPIYLLVYQSAKILFYSANTSKYIFISLLIYPSISWTYSNEIIPYFYVSISLFLFVCLSVSYLFRTSFSLCPFYFKVIHYVLRFFSRFTFAPCLFFHQIVSIIFHLNLVFSFFTLSLSFYIWD